MASPARRLVAYLVDVILLKVIGLVITILLIFTLDLSIWKALMKPSLITDIGAYRQLALAAALVGELAIAFAYFTFFEAKTGQTIGKRVMEVRVLGNDNQTPTFKEATLRNITRTLWYLPGWLGFLISVVELLILLEEPHQRLGDRLAGTRVVKPGLEYIHPPIATPVPTSESESPPPPKSEPVTIYNVDGDYVAGDKTQINDSVVNRSQVGGRRQNGLNDEEGQTSKDPTDPSQSRQDE